MKPNAFLRRFLAIAGSAALAAPLANATTLYWDIDGATAGSGGATPSGTWSTGGSTWSTDSTGATATSAYTTTVFDDLFFSAATDATGAYAVSLNSSTQSARLVTFEDGTATLSAGTGTLSLGTGGGLTVTSGTVTGATISSNLTLSGAQTFNVAASRTLTLDTGTFTRNAGATLNVASTGAVTSTMTNLASGSMVNGIIGPWASFGSGASTKYATFSGSTIAGLTGTAAATAANVTDTTGAFNYDVAAVGALGAGANINTLRYTGAAGTISGALTTKGIMNVGGGTLTFSGAVTGSGELVVNTANGDIAFNAANAAGSYGLVKVGSGRLTTANIDTTYSGTVTVNGGVLQYGDTIARLTTGNITLNGGVIEQRWGESITKTQGSGAGQIQILGGESGFSENGSTGLTWNIGAVTWGSATFNPTKFLLQLATSQSASSLTFASAIDLNGANRTIVAGAGTTGAATSTLSGVISNGTGTAGLIKEGPGYLALSNTNSYNGATTISAGTLDATTFAAINTNSSIGKGSVGGSAADLVINGGILRHSAANVATTNRLFSIGTSGGTIDSSGSGTNTLSFTGTGAMAFNGQLGTRTLTLTGSNTGNNSMGVLIGNDGSSNATSVTKTGAGLWILANASNSYTGPTTITAGTLSVSSTGNLGGASSNLVFNGGTLQITNTTNLPNFSTIGHTVSFTSGQTVGLDISSGTFTADQTLNQGTGGLTKLGTGTLVINQANTYTGTTTISAGTLRLDSGGSIAGSIINNAIYLVNQNATAGTAPLAKIAGSGSIAAGPSATITIDTAKGLGFNALDTTGGGSFVLSGVTTPTLGGLSGTTGNLSSSFSSGYTSGVTSLTLDTAGNNIAGNSFTYGGVINDGATGMSLTKTGAGTQTLTGTNTYTGTTYLNGGTLAIGSGSTIGKLSGTTDLNFNGGTLQFNRSTASDINAINNAATITVNASSTFGVTSADAGGASANETIGAVTLNAGQMNFNWTNGGSSGTQMILTSLARSGTASANFNSGFSAASSRWKVTGAGTTTAGQIIGPWYTTGGNNAGFASTDYAVYSSDFVAQAAIAGSAETTWTTAANAYTTSAGGTVTLTGTRTITALRNTGATTVLTLASGANLETYGLLNGVATLLTVAPGTGGVLTTPTGGGNLYINAGAGAITVSAPINNNSGNVTLVKNGSNTLTLTSTTSNFSGGVVLNAGTLSIDDVRSIGGTNNTGGSTVPITVNGSSTISMPTNNLIANFGTGAITIAKGATLTVSSSSRGDLRFGGAVTGDGGLTFTSGSFWSQYTFTSTANTFTGAITDSRSGNDAINNAVLRFNSIADGAGYGNIILNGANDSGIDYGSGAIAPLNLNNRQLILANNNTIFFNNASSQAVNINTDIGFSGTGARQIRFGITGAAAHTPGTGINTINGKMTDNVGGAFTPTFNGGTWNVTNTNTYTGTTTVSAGVLGFANGSLGSSGTINASGGTLRWLSGNTQDISSRLAMTAATTTTLDTNGNNVTFASAIGSSSTALLTKTGLGTLTLAGNNTYTGITTVNGGTLLLDKTGTGAIAATSALTLGGGIFNVKGATSGATTQTLGALTLNVGSTNQIVLDSNGGSSNTLTLANSAPTRANASTLLIDLSSANTVLTSTLGLTAAAQTVTQGVLGYAVVKNSSGFGFAANVGGNIVRYTGAEVLTGSAPTAGANVITSPTGSSSSGSPYLTTSASPTYNSLRIDTSGATGANFLSLNGTVTLTSRGILMTGNNDFTIQGGTSLGASGNETIIHNYGTGTLFINSPILTLAAPVSKDGPGTVVMGNATSSFQNAFRINEGILRLGSAGGATNGPLGTIGQGTTVHIGGALDLGGFTLGTAEALTISGTGVSSGGALTNSGGAASYSGLLTLGSDASIVASVGDISLTNAGTITGAGFGLTVGGAANTSIGSIIGTGSGTLTKTGAGTLTLSVANTYTGGTTLNGGTISFVNNALSTTGNVTFTGNSTLQWGVSNTQDLSSRLVMTNGVTSTLDTGSNSVIFASAIGSSTTGALTKAGSGTLTLSGTNTYTGKTTVQNGTLSFSVGNASATANQQLGANAALDLGVALTSSGRLLYTGGAGTLAKNINALGNGSDTIENGGTGLLTLTGTLTKDGTTLTLKGGANGITISGSGTITGSSANSDLIVDGGVVTLTTANSYNGPTYVINGATLNANAANALPTSVARTAVIMDQTGSGTSSLAMTVSQSIASLTGASTSTVNLNANTLTIGTTSGSTNFQGAINGSSGNLIKDGGSTQVLSGTNGYTGTTTVSGGALAVDGSLANTTTTVGNTGTLQGSGTIGGSVTIQSGGTLAPGNSIESLGTGALSFEAGSTYAYELQTTLYAGTPGVAGDLTFSSGTLDIQAGSILTLTDLAASMALAAGSKLTLISYFGGWTGTELFSYDAGAGLATLNDGATITLGANQWIFDYNDTTGGPNFGADQAGASAFVTMTVVPEPGAAFIGSLGLLALLRRRRN